MKLNKQILKEMIEEELNECGCGMPPPPPPVHGPPEGSDDAEMANQIADLVADVIYKVLMFNKSEEAGHHDAEAAHSGESHEFAQIMKMFRQAGIDAVLEEASE